mgnify:CR=1 FL=1
MKLILTSWLQNLVKQVDSKWASTFVATQQTTSWPIYSEAITSIQIKIGTVNVAQALCLSSTSSCQICSCLAFIAALQDLIKFATVCANGKTCQSSKLIINFKKVWLNMLVNRIIRQRNLSSIRLIYFYFAMRPLSSHLLRSKYVIFCKFDALMFLHL